MRRAAIAFALAGLGSGCVGLEYDTGDLPPPPRRVSGAPGPDHHPPPARLPPVGSTLPTTAVQAEAREPLVSSVRRTVWNDLAVAREMVFRRSSATVLTEMPPATPAPPTLSPVDSTELLWQSATDQPVSPKSVPPPTPDPTPKPVAQPSVADPVTWGKAKER